MPPVLQTEEYARAHVIATARTPSDDRLIWQLTDLRVRRQEMLLSRLDRAAPPRVSQVIDESVLFRPIGDGAVMARQLDHLMAMAERRTVHAAP